LQPYERISLFNEKDKELREVFSDSDMEVLMVKEN
jgi:hypothetical protein